MRRVAGHLGLFVVLALTAGCGKSQPKLSQLSGKVTFKGQPVPAGYITFQAEAGPVKMARITNGVYDTSTAKEPGVHPGKVVIRISGFDGKKIDFFPDGKQIFNSHELRDTIPEGTATKDFDVPASAANNLKIERTADVP